MDAWKWINIIILISNSVWFREFRYNGLLKGTDGDYRPDVISMNMKENYNFKGADGDYRPHFFKG